MSTGSRSGTTQAGGWRRPMRPPAPQDIPMTGSLSAQPPWDPTPSFLPCSASPPEMLPAQLRCDHFPTPRSIGYTPRAWAGVRIWELNFATKKLRARTWLEGRKTIKRPHRASIPGPEEAARGSLSRPCRCTLLLSLASLLRFGLLELCKVVFPRLSITLGHTRDHIVFRTLVPLLTLGEGIEG